MQIVNGGQTTGTIALAYDEGKADLANVAVPMKISVIRNSENAKEIVDNISRSANSQTAIKNSDFSANEPYLVDLETFSRIEWVPNGTSKPTNKWYFERTRGQYLDELAQLNGINARMFKREYPKSMKLTKTDIAIYEECWKGCPNIACKGGEESYKQFVKDIKQSETKCNLTYYRQLIAKAILFKAIDKISMIHQVTGFKSCVNAYILYSISYLSSKKLDLEYIWENQTIQPDLKEYISELLLPLVCTHLADGNTSPSRYARTSDCVLTLIEKFGFLPLLPVTVIKEHEEGENEEQNKAKQEKMEEAANIPAETWFSIAKWAKSNNYLTPMAQKQAYNYGVMKQCGRRLSFKQACNGIGILNEAQSLGFTL